MTYTYQAPPIPKAFIWRRAHSLTGLWLVLFLIEHLLTNSQAALFVGDDGSGFVAAVNWIKGLPYLPLIEISLLGLPLLIHGFWGIHYLFQAKYNTQPSDGSQPSLPGHFRNHAYTWQRITSWILLFGIVAHVIHMRFLEYPVTAQVDTQHYYLVRLEKDNGLYTLSKRLGFDLYSQSQIQEIKQTIFSHLGPLVALEETPEQLIAAQKNREEKAWVEAFESLHINANQLVAASKTFGIAELLIVRDTFKKLSMIFLYTGLVIAACFHAFNGLWTFMITWGISLTARSQNFMRKMATLLMIMIAFLGFAAIWGTYWFNLSH
ncbi:succinate dehydrogenase cytochrome b558 subunit [Candidatus Protochlamydia sp. R18]|uniref:succinate dehydrogenase cytochrome b558 subunit n=1 Tax=Candidatus Protochlamydia sp. R18 TaxID=1353977 RepID=UPI0005A97E1D|nr:succinate dehydrogenase cytochrome b558 subunit [Candidatus Protochlamydia sp. R18]